MQRGIVRSFDYMKHNKLSALRCRDIIYVLGIPSEEMAKFTYVSVWFE